MKNSLARLQQAQLARHNSNKRRALSQDFMSIPEDEALIKLQPLLNSQGTNFEQLIELGNHCMRVGRYQVACSIYATWTQKAPENSDAWSNLGASLVRLRKAKEAKVVLLHGAALDPENANIPINLSGVLQELGEFEEALKVSLDAVRLNPRSALAFNNLSSALADLGMTQEARHACDTALMLEPENEYARINRIKLYLKQEGSDEGMAQMEALLAEEESRGGLHADLLRYHLSFEYLARGRVKEGFRFYECGLSPHIPQGMARNPARKFAVPRWDGGLLSKDKTLLVWREQGIGDEILFGTCLKELENLQCRVILETDARLVDIYQRSFPRFIVRAQAYLPHENFAPIFNDYDFHLPIGSLPALYRDSLHSFERCRQPFLKPDPARTQKFRERLAPYEGKRLIGICWRSGIVGITRNSGYSHLVDWTSLLSNPDYQFVNLQYGDCEAEIAELERELGVTLLRWPDLNLKDDLSDVFALISCLDMVVSAATAVFPMAGAVGTPALQLNRPHWVNFGSPTDYPWFLHARITGWDGLTPIAMELRKVPEIIEDMTSVHI